MNIKVCIIKDNERNQAIFSFISATRRSLHVQTDFYTNLNAIQPKFNGLVFGLWPTLSLTYRKIGLANQNLMYLSLVKLIVNLFLLCNKSNVLRR